MVIDTTPLVPVNDARLIASLVDATLIVASVGATTRGAVQDAVHRLAPISIAPTAAVLNKSKNRQARSYYGRGRKPEPAEEAAPALRGHV